MQVELATIRRGRDQLTVFVGTLGWSRDLRQVHHCDSAYARESDPRRAAINTR